MKKLNGFDAIAGWYDALASFVYGGAIRRSQITFLDQIAPGSNVLIIGGGSGWILEELLKKVAGIKVVYVDASQRMLTKAKQRMGEASRVQFIHGTEADVPVDIAFDAILTFYFLDMFPDERLRIMIRNLSAHTSTKSLWLAADFRYSGKAWQQLLLTIMYSFFHRFAKVEAVNLPDWNHGLSSAGWNLRVSKTYFNNFIESTVYVRGQATL